MSEYRRRAYFGRMTSTALTLISSSRLRPDTMSPSPPALAAGAHSGVTITTYTAPPRVDLRRHRTLPQKQPRAPPRPAASPLWGDWPQTAAGRVSFPRVPYPSSGPGGPRGYA
jgi:hypothetical protein